MSIKEQYWKYSLIVIILFMGIIIFRQITPFLGGLLGALTIYILVRTQMETETQCCRIADYGRDGYGIFGSARTDNLATGKPTSGHQSGPANIHCPDAAGGRVYQRKNGL